MMNDIQVTGKVFGMVLADDDGNIAETGTMIENIDRFIINTLIP